VGAIRLDGIEVIQAATLTTLETEPLWQNWALPGIGRLDPYRRDGQAGFIGVGGGEAEDCAGARSAVPWRVDQRLCIHDN